MFKGIIKKYEEKFIRTVPKIEVGDVVSVKVLINDVNKKRLQTFEGVAIAIKNRSINSSFTLRKQSNQFTIEKVFVTHSPLISEIKVLRKGRVRRAKLYYLRKLSGKAARIKGRIEKSSTQT